jgi:hypothetical protein
VWSVASRRRDADSTSNERVGFTQLFAAGAWTLLSLLLAALALDEPALAPTLTLVWVALACAAVLRLTGARIGALAGLVKAPTLQGAGAVIVAVALAGALVRVPGVLASVDSALTGTSYSLAQADLEPLSEYGSTEALAAAARLIPLDATYAVVAGDQYRVPYMFELWLLPRTLSWNPHDASWVIVYEQPLPAGLDVVKRLRLAPDVVALEVAG